MQQTKDSVWQIGPDTRDLVTLLRSGENEKALLSLLVIPENLPARPLAVVVCAERVCRRMMRLANRLWSVSSAATGASDRWKGEDHWLFALIDS